ncbi:lactate utilization protein [Desulfobacter latus]|uniref:Lactate utilization protein n=1 Tax=Desulfobacter latus TaxID=2292 RepID=A0A850T119_9BACT|nr:lactate utilization protein [Desulfobacter latus]NWH06030.1 lactate utilization protein [Desulfobacter latus]
MKNPIDNYWKLKFENVKEALESNNFEVFIADNSKEASKIVLEKIIPNENIKSISWGGSMTFVGTGLYDALKNKNEFKILDTFDKSLSNDEKTQLRREALLTDLFVTGTNALTEDGCLVNLDMIGNRVGAMTFGPNNVLILTGRNKIVPDIDTAMERIKNYVAPTNAMRLDMKTPCVKTGECSECKASARICNSWTITQKSFPPKRVKIVLINEDLGL